MALELLWTLAAFSLLYAVGRSPWARDQAVARRKAATYSQNKRTQTSIPLAEIELMIPVFERRKTVLALDLAATVTGVSV
jgi:hypothetical protein